MEPGTSRRTCFRRKRRVVDSAAGNPAAQGWNLRRALVVSVQPADAAIMGDIAAARRHCRRHVCGAVPAVGGDLLEGAWRGRRERSSQRRNEENGDERKENTAAPP